jgi:hypothetical protein
VKIGHAVTLAPFCGSTEFLYSDSLYIECQFGNQFYKPKVDEVYRYSCAETVLFDGTTTTNTTMDIPSATIMTDQSWQDDYFSDCVRTYPGPPSTAIFAGPMSAPQATAIAPAVISGSTAGNGGGGSVPDVVPRVVGDETSKEQEAPLGIIVGVPVAAVLILAIAILFRWKSPSHRTAGYHSGQGGGRDDDDRPQGQYMGHAPAFADTPPAPYATVQVLPAEAIIDIPSSAWTDRGGVLPKSLRQSPNDHDVPHGGCGAGNNRGASDGVVVGDGVVGDVDGKGDGPCTSSPGQQQHNVAVTFKDQAQSVVVDGHPMAGNSIFAPRMMAEERNAPAAASDGTRDAYQQPDNQMVAPVAAFKDYTQSMIRPESSATTTALEEEKGRPSATISSSGLSDSSTRGASDPSGIQPQKDDDHASASVGQHYLEL